MVPPPETALGSLIAYVTDSGRRDFQPMNANYGLMPELAGPAFAAPKRKSRSATRALNAIDEWIDFNAMRAITSLGVITIANAASRVSDEARSLRRRHQYRSDARRRIATR